jgi:hypothetical protein
MHTPQSEAPRMPSMQLRMSKLSKQLSHASVQKTTPLYKSVYSSFTVNLKVEATCFFQFLSTEFPILSLCKYYSLRTLTRKYFKYGNGIQEGIFQGIVSPDYVFHIVKQALVGTYDIGLKRGSTATHTKHLPILFFLRRRFELTLSAYIIIYCHFPKLFDQSESVSHCRRSHSLFPIG